MEVIRFLGPFGYTNEKGEKLYFSLFSCGDNMERNWRYGYGRDFATQHEANNYGIRLLKRFARMYGYVLENAPEAWICYDRPEKQGWYFLAPANVDKE